jgi:hypothetical protein
MKRFVLAAALALVGALGFSNTADAQYVYGYRTFVPGGGVVQNTTFATPFGVRSTAGIYTPFGSTYRSNYADVWGNSAFRTGGYSPYTNFGYRTGYNYTPYGFYGPSYNRFGYGGFRW